MANRPWVTVFPPEPERYGIPPVFPELHHMPQRDAAPVEYFFLIFTANLMKEFVRQTNRYARHYINTQVLSRYARIKKWKPVRLPEFRRFLSVIYNMGIVRKSRISEYWNRSFESQETPWFGRIMSRNRFQIILKCLHITDFNKTPSRGDPGYSPDSRFKPLLTFVNNRFKALYTPQRELSIDESLVASKGKSIMRQYIPSKAAKFGIKFWMIVEACSGYVMNMTVYRGKRYDPTPKGEQQGTNVVMFLLRACELLNKGYHIFCDSFFQFNEPR